MTQFDVFSFGLSPTTEWNRDLYASLAAGSTAGALNDSPSSSVVFLTMADAADPNPNLLLVLDDSLATSAFCREYFDAPLGKERLVAVPFVEEALAPLVLPAEELGAELGVELGVRAAAVSCWSLFIFF